METSRQFRAGGEIHPRGWPGGVSQLRAECLIEGAEPHIEMRVRFLQATERLVLDAAGEPVDELIVTGQRYTSGEETREHEIALSSPPNRKAAVGTAGSERAELGEGGSPAGALVWRWEPMHATVEAWIEEIGPGLRRVRVDVANRLEWEGGANEQAQLQTLRATHVLLHSPDGAFVSLTDPPAHLREHAADCRNDGLWPVPVGEADDHRTVLAAPPGLEDGPHHAALR